MRREGERGVALLTVLLLVAVMAVVAIAVLDDLRFAVRRTANARTMAQAQWYALGAEELARVQIVRRARLDADRTTLEGGWSGRTFTFPIEAGAIEARVSGASGCFNLNSVVEGGGDRYVRHELGARQFMVLLSAIGFNDAAAAGLQGALVDWIDSDDVALAAEDRAYASAATPYRTAGAPLAEVSELRAIRGFTDEVYGRIRPFVCALPVGLSQINVNTLPADRAVLLTMLTEGRVSPAAARRILMERPASGWPNVDAFWNEPGLVNHAPGGPAREQAVVRTGFYAMDARVEFGGSHATLSSLFEAQGGGVRLIARRWTPEE
ncbi:MAG TPA: type II secretion system minor pseudopilin GspK [Caulobacteraceae bacterium]|nr:type II secretion system minor pseudopilin GspK [Caulobacteraceae bacterium]